MDNAQFEIDWVTFLKDIKALAQKIKKATAAKPFNKILVVTKGGLIPSYYLAKYLGIKYLETLAVNSYDANNKKLEKPKVIPEGKKRDRRSGWLIVDDLVDSGDTMKLAKKLYPKASFACLYKKQNSPVPDFYLNEAIGWIVFPWEVNDLKAVSEGVNLTIKI